MFNIRLTKSDLVMLFDLDDADKLAAVFALMDEHDADIRDEYELNYHLIEPYNSAIACSYDEFKDLFEHLDYEYMDGFAIRMDVSI